MKPKGAIKLAVDILMTLALLFLMGYQFWGEAPHEWVGAVTFAFFIVHHVLNSRWHKVLFKGRYSPIRILTLCIDCLLLISMLAQMYSGIVISKYVFDFFSLGGGMALARRLHILGAYWGFLFMSLHLGIHWNMILRMLRKVGGIKNKSKTRSAIWFIAGLTIAGYGVWVLISRELPTYLLLKSEFVFLDYSESKILFYIDYLALMGLCIFITHYSGKIIRKTKEKMEA